MEKFLDIGRRIGAWIWKHKIATSVIVLAVLLLAVPIRFAYADGELFNQFAQNPLDVTAILLAGIIQNITAAIGKLVLLIIEAIVIPILGYNGFYNSHITNLGWSLVRDIVNMFVVVVLLVIAVMTIVGYSHANWTQSLPRLFIAIVLVNFSKLICGLAIDISQVIMFTFVNAIVSIAAGNFASMLGLSTFGKFGSEFVDKINASGDGIQAFMFLGGAYLQFVIYIAILAVMFLLAVAFVWRIVILWILIIMAPMAFFSWGIGDVFHSAGSAYSQWMSKFTSALTFGPILVFFLWLSLAASSGSTLAKTEDFPFPDDKNNSGLELESFTLDNFLGMFLALAILIAGMQQAASAAKGMEGFASSVLSEKNGIAASKWLAKSPFKAAGGFKNERAWVNKQAKAGATATANFAPKLTAGVGKNIAGWGTAASTIPGLGWAGNATAAVGGNIVKAAKDVQKEHAKHGADDLKSRTDDQTKWLDAAAVTNQNAFASLPEEEREAYYKSFATDQKRRDKFKKNRREVLEKQNFKGDIDAQVLADHNAVFATSMAEMSTPEGKNLMDDAEKDRLQDAKFANLHLADPSKRQEIWDEQEKEGRLNLGLLSADSLKDESSRAFLKTAKARRENGKDVTAWNDILINGKGTQAQRDAMISTISRADVTDTDAAVRRDSIGTLVKAGAVTTADATGRREGVMETIRSSRPDDLGRRTYGKAAAALLDGKNADGTQVSTAAVFGDGFASIGTGDLPEDNVEYQRAGAMVEADSKSVRHLDGLIGDTANAASQIATSKVNLEAVKKLQKAADDDGGEGDSSRALKTMEKAVHAEISRPGIDPKERSRLVNVAKQLGTGARYSLAGRAAPAPTPVDVEEDDGGDDDDGGPGPAPIGGGGGRPGPVGGGGRGGGAAPAAGGGGGPAVGGGAGAAAAGAAGATAAQRFVARGRAAMAANAAAAATPEPEQQTAAQRFVARGRAAMAANAASAAPASTPESDSSSTVSNSRPRSQVRTSAVRQPDRYGSAARPNSAAPRRPDPYGSAQRGNPPVIRQTRGPGSSPSAGGGAV